LLAEGMKRSPATADLHLLQGMLRQRQARHEDAIDSFSRAIYCDATFSLAWFYRAAVLELKGDDQRAASDYQTAARCFRHDPPERWDVFLESMGHEAMVRLCDERAATLGMADAKT
jgi:Flp pilus assembly protein TadD